MTATMTRHRHGPPQLDGREREGHPRHRLRIPRLPGRPRRLVRAAHIIVSGGWLGLVVAMLVLGIGAAATHDVAFSLASYTVMERIGRVAIPIFAVATILTGVLLSVATPWGLLQHRWVVVKQVLTIAVIVTGARLTGQWVHPAMTGAGSAAWLVIGGSAAHLLMLGFAMVISVDKPWGKTRRGRRLGADRAAQARKEARRRPEPGDTGDARPADHRQHSPRRASEAA